MKSRCRRDHPLACHEDDVFAIILLDVVGNSFEISGLEAHSFRCSTNKEQMPFRVGPIRLNRPFWLVLHFFFQEKEKHASGSVVHNLSFKQIFSVLFNFSYPNVVVESLLVHNSSCFLNNCSSLLCSSSSCEEEDSKLACSGCSCARMCSSIFITG